MQVGQLTHILFGNGDSIALGIVLEVQEYTATVLFIEKDHKDSLAVGCTISILNRWEEEYQAWRKKN